MLAPDLSARLRHSARARWGLDYESVHDAHPEALVFGAGDLSASLHARVDGNFDRWTSNRGDFWQFALAQVVTANEVFAPTPQAVGEARAAIGAYRSAEAEGIGVIGRDGRLVDAAHMRLAANILHKASLEEGDR